MSLTKHIRNTEKLLVMVLPLVLIEEILGKAVIQAGERRKLCCKKKLYSIFFK